MREWMDRINQVQRRRHMLFWIAWVLGFTFIKSFGEPLDYYLGWFSYYVLTLPLFMAHTYLVADVLVPRFLKQERWPWFVLGFLLAFCAFSVLELLFSNAFIYRWFTTGQELMDDYLSPVNVVGNGLGNLYIVFVFLAARTLRNWYQADQEQKNLEQGALQEQRDHARTRVQPMMLLYAIDKIDAMAHSSSPEVTRAIALTSELLSEVMMYQEEKKRWFSREIVLVKKLIVLMGLLREKEADVEFFVSGDPEQVDVPPMILFSLVDLVFRRFDNAEQFPEMHVEVNGFSNMLSLQLLYTRSGRKEEGLEECMLTLMRLQDVYKDRVRFSFSKLPYGCSVVIRSEASQPANGIHGPASVIDPSAILPD